MKTPFVTLEVAEDAPDEEVKKAYLAKVRERPPDRFPEEFQEIRAAYEAVKTRKARLRYLLFDTAPPAGTILIDMILKDAGFHAPSAGTLTGFLAAVAGRSKIAAE